MAPRAHRHDVRMLGAACCPLIMAERRPCIFRMVAGFGVAVEAANAGSRMDRLRPVAKVRTRAVPVARDAFVGACVETRLRSQGGSGAPPRKKPECDQQTPKASDATPSVHRAPARTRAVPDTNQAPRKGNIERSWNASCGGRLPDGVCCLESFRQDLEAAQAVVRSARRRLHPRESGDCRRRRARLWLAHCRADVRSVNNGAASGARGPLAVRSNAWITLIVRQRGGQVPPTRASQRGGRTGRRPRVGAGRTVAKEPGSRRDLEGPGEGWWPSPGL